MYKYSIELLRLSRNINFGVWLPMSITSSRVLNVPFSEQLQDTGGVSGENMRLLMAGEFGVISVQVCTVGSAQITTDQKIVTALFNMSGRKCDRQRRFRMLTRERASLPCCAYCSCLVE